MIQNYSQWGKFLKGGDTLIGPWRVADSDWWVDMREQVKKGAAS